MIANPDELHLFDLDGTLNTIDVQASMENPEQGDPEIIHYLAGVSRFVEEASGLPYEAIFHGIREKVLADFDKRATLDYWGRFAAKKEAGVPKEYFAVTPAVDHYLLIQRAVRGFLEDQKAMIQGVAGGDPSKIDRLLDPGRNLAHEVYTAGSQASVQQSEIEDAGKAVLDDGLSKNQPMAVLTNSSPTKAMSMLQKAGFADRHLLENHVQPGKIGVVGWACKFEVDRAMEQAVLDLTEFYGERILLDLRRGAFRQRVAEFMEEAGTSQVFMASDIPELDHYPLQAWYGERARLAMKINPTSAPESIAAFEGLISGRASENLAELV